MKIQEKKELLKHMLQTSVLFLLIYGVMLVKHFSNDSYAYWANPEANNIGNLSLGRIGDFVVNKIICKLQINYVDQQFIFVLILILTLSVSAELIFNHYIKNLKKTPNKTKLFLLKTAIILMFCNVFILEWFVFVEMSLLWSFSIIFMTYAVLQIKAEFNIKRLFLCTLLLTISVSFYQAVIGYFMVFGLFSIYILHDGELNKKSFLDNFKVVLCAGLAGSINLLSIKLMQSLEIANITSRTDSLTIDTLISNINIILITIKKWIIDTYGLLPKYSLLSAIIFINLLLLIWCILSRCKLKNFIYILAMIFLCNVIVYIPHLLTSSVWMPQRTIISFWAIVSLPCMIIAIKNENRYIQGISYVVISLLLILNISRIQQISANVIAHNKIDEEISYLIKDKIHNYEIETGNTIESIAIINDTAPAWSYQSIEFSCLDTNVRIYNVGWGGIECINYYNGTNYQRVEMDEEIYNKHFADRNWDYLDLEEQMVFDGNTLYMVSY